MKPKPFEIDFEIPPPLTVKETAKKYGVSMAFIRRVERLLGLPPIEAIEGRRRVDRTAARRRRAKTGTRKK